MNAIQPAKFQTTTDIVAPSYGNLDFKTGLVGADFKPDPSASPIHKYLDKMESSVDPLKAAVDAVKNFKIDWGKEDKEPRAEPKIVTDFRTTLDAVLFGTSNRAENMISMARTFDVLNIESAAECSTKLEQVAIQSDRLQTRQERLKDVRALKEELSATIMDSDLPTQSYRKFSKLVSTTLDRAEAFLKESADCCGDTRTFLEGVKQRFETPVTPANGINILSSHSDTGEMVVQSGVSPDLAGSTFFGSAIVTPTRSAPPAPAEKKSETTPVTAAPPVPPVSAEASNTPDVSATPDASAAPAVSKSAADKAPEAPVNSETAPVTAVPPVPPVSAEASKAPDASATLPAAADKAAEAPVESAPAETSPAPVTKTAAKRETETPTAPDASAAPAVSTSAADKAPEAPVNAAPSKTAADPVAPVTAASESSPTVAPTPGAASEKPVEKTETKSPAASVATTFATALKNEPSLIERFKEVVSAAKAAISEERAAVTPRLEEEQAKLDHIAAVKSKSLWGRFRSGEITAAIPFVGNYLLNRRESVIKRGMEPLQQREADFSPGSEVYRMAMNEEIRNELQGTDFTIEKGVPKAIVAAAIPLAKKDTLMNFDNLVLKVWNEVQLPEGAKKSETETGGLLITHADGSSMRLEHKRDGRVHVYTKAAGEEAKEEKLGTAWSDDAFKLADRFARQVDLNIRKNSIAGQQFYIPEPDYFRR